MNCKIKDNAFELLGGKDFFLNEMLDGPWKIYATEEVILTLIETGDEKIIRELDRVFLFNESDVDIDIYYSEELLENHFNTSKQLGILNTEYFFEKGYVFFKKNCNILSPDIYFLDNSFTQESEIFYSSYSKKIGKTFKFMLINGFPKNRSLQEVKSKYGVKKIVTESNPQILERLITTRGDGKIRLDSRMHARFLSEKQHRIYFDFYGSLSEDIHKCKEAGMCRKKCELFSYCNHISLDFPNIIVSRFGNHA